MAEELPKQQLLLKLLNMSTSSTDGEALVAIRKANELLRTAGWTWEKLLAGKITVVGDPFAGVEEIQKKPAPAQPTAPYRPTPKPAPQPKKPLWTRPSMPSSHPGLGNMWIWDNLANTWVVVSDPSYTPPQVAAINSKLGNRYENYCYCCGALVESGKGWIFHPSDVNPKAPNKWEVVCDPCNKTTNPTVGLSRAKRVYPAHQASSHVDLGNL